MTRVAVIGAGSWGTTVAAIAAVNADAVLWARDPARRGARRPRARNPDYLPDIALPEALRATVGPRSRRCTGADVVVMGVPSHGFRDVLADGGARDRADAPSSACRRAWSRAPCCA